MMIIFIGASKFFFRFHRISCDMACVDDTEMAWTNSTQVVSDKTLKEEGQNNTKE